MTIKVYSNNPKQTRKRLLKAYGMKRTRNDDIFIKGKDDYLRIAFKDMSEVTDDGILYFGGYIYKLADEITAEYWRRRKERDYIEREDMLIERDAI